MTNENKYRNANALAMATVLIMSIIISFSLSYMFIPSGKQGPQGSQGIQGPKGDAGTVPADVKVALTDTWTYIWLDPDSHLVEGFAINFGTTTAYEVTVKLSWYMGNGLYTDLTLYLGTMLPHAIKQVSSTYYFDGQGFLLYSIAWK